MMNTSTLKAIAEAIAERLANSGIIVEASVDAVMNAINWDDVRNMSREVRRDLYAYALDRALEDDDTVWGDVCGVVGGFMDDEYYNENIDDFLEYQSHMGEPNFDWSFYSDWHKDMYGFRPR